MPMPKLTAAMKTTLGAFGFLAFMAELYVAHEFAFALLGKH
jgi:hypothetical protein